MLELEVPLAWLLGPKLAMELSDLMEEFVGIEYLKRLPTQIRTAIVLVLNIGLLVLFIYFTTTSTYAS
jgi:hypothetical protein